MNTNAQPNREKEIFEAAVEITAPEERHAFLNTACVGDNSLRARVDALLHAHADASQFLGEQPAATSAIGLTVPDEEKAGAFIGRYKLLEKIGEGGFGVVYMAEQREPVKRRLALKIIKVGMDTREVVARFEAERQALALMDHPNIAKVLDGGATENGRPYFVMELVRGIKITDYCDQSQLGLEARLKLFMEVCHAVQHAHQKGIIHRDLKPSNILVTLHDGVPVPKVIDFGIAKATQQELTEKTLFTQFHQFIGTPSYMSPEQAELSGLDIDTRSDIYSLGVLLYELLVGQPPFDGQALLKAGLDEMRRTLREVEPPRPSARLTQSLVAADVRRLAAKPEDRVPKSEEEIRADSRRLLRAKELIHQLRGDLDWIVMKCLEKDRARRYETANGLAADLQRHLGNEPVVARPPSATYRFQKMVRRNKLVFASAAAVVTALTIGLGISLWQGVEKTRAYRRAVAAEKAAGTEAAKSRQVAQFLKDMLGAAGPSVDRGRDAQMLREILDKTAERVSKDLTDQPEVEADLRIIIGNAYADLGAHDQAGAMFSEALAIRRRVLGQKHRQVAAALNDLGINLRLRGEMGGAESQAREALVMSRELLGPQNLEAARSLHTLALVAWKRHELVPAEAMAREALEIRRQLLGLEHPDVAYSLGALGLVLLHQSRLTEAEALLREDLAMLRKLLGEDHKDVAGPLNNLASVLLAQGKLGEAEAQHRELLAREKSCWASIILTRCGR